MTRTASSRALSIHALQLQWGWITPGTCSSHRRGQWEAYRRFLRRPVRPENRRLLLLHCGWWLDAGAGAWVRDLTRRNPEPNRSLEPCRGRDLAFLRVPVRSGRVEMVLFPYAACIAEATSGEALLRGFRFSLGILGKGLGARARVLMNHDGVYGLDWGCSQMPQVSRLLGVPMLVAGVEGEVVAPDGTVVRAIGSDPRWYVALGAARPGGAPVSFTAELHQHLRLLDQFEAGKVPVRLSASVEGVSLDAYLASNPAHPRIEARRMGAKGWYGGVHDSLLLEQNVKGVELRLPALEAAAVLAGGGRVPGAISARLAEFWKGALILMDNHTLWQCHDYRRHTLPRSARFVREVADLEKSILGHDPLGRRTFLFNPVPWRRDLVVETPRGALVARGVPGWGAAQARPAVPSHGRGGSDPRCLANRLARFQLNPLGEVVGASVGGRRREFGGLGRLVEIREKPSRERAWLSDGRELRGFEGSASVACEAELPRGWDGAIFTASVEGEAFLLQVERLGAGGGCDWIALHNLHWGGPGLPNPSMKLGPLSLPCRGARRLRLTLWMLAEGRLAVRGARLRPAGKRGAGIALPKWEARLHYRVEVARATPRAAARVRGLDGLQVSRFTGELPSSRYELFTALREGGRVLEYRLRLRFARPTRLGLSTPPFSEDEGSLLGAQCERPYVPGLAVLFPLPGRARYFSDKPWDFAEAFRDSPRTWHTNRPDWWLGMSPFLGMNMAVADWGRGKLGVLTRGLKHFFRWKRVGAESLGLSLGATIIHPSTQGHSVPRSSRFFKLVGRRDHDPYVRTRFLRARGISEFHYAVRPVPLGETGLSGTWRAAQEFALSPTLFLADGISAGLAEGARCNGEGVVLSSLEPRTGGGLASRLVNLSGEAQCPRLVLSGLGKSAARSLPPYAVREVDL